MRRIALLVGLVISTGLPACAQEYPKVEIFAGGSFLSKDAGLLGREPFGGWQASVTWNVTKHIGLTADFGGHYGSISGLRTSQYEFLGGPRFTARAKKANLFAHTLLVGGVIRSTTGLTRRFAAMGFGGGIDLNGGRRFAIRAFQFDYLPNNSRVGWLHDIRLGFGVVMKLGQ